MEGSSVGWSLGLDDGAVDGANVGYIVGEACGEPDGASVGTDFVGTRDGRLVDGGIVVDCDGSSDGDTLGCLEGNTVGKRVGGENEG